MSERFLKFIPSEEAMYLLTQKGHAFRLLTIIAEAARRYEGGADGLKIGEALIGGHENYDMTERNYRTAKDILERRRHIEIVETCRTRKKVTTGTTTVGTRVKLLSSNVWDINFNTNDDRNDDRPTTDRRPTDDELRRNKIDKEDHPSIPSFAGRGEGTDDFSLRKKKEHNINYQDPPSSEPSLEVIPGVFLSKKDFEDCVKIKGDAEKVKHAITFIQNSKKRKHPISDWPNALSNWKIENDVKIKIEDNISYADKLCQVFSDYSIGKGWRCHMQNDSKKDQRGILFENESPHSQPFFISLTDLEFKKKCYNLLIQNRMILKEKTNDSF